MLQRDFKVILRFGGVHASCCGYLCNFQVYSSRSTNPKTGSKVLEVRLVSIVVKSLLKPYYDCNHVLYCDNFSTSSPLACDLAQKRVQWNPTLWTPLKYGHPQ